ncbi:alpha-tocopherol transfer protein-like [Caerostris darwini]|uniref:Alpha-tocopherol transfer protein-like n=1 Tax=Caerostris darwini TaxID=1538125 RepID=A0AAV4QYG7_9ARAC|nr:alpha-tocopherol transfer protein-like [Caerostris darwini]
MLVKKIEGLSDETEVLPFEVGHLPERFQQEVLNKTNETPERKLKGLQKLKQLIKSENIFDDTEFDEDFLVLFLRSEDYDVLSALQRLKNAVALKKSYVEMFSDQVYENIAITFTKNITTFLPYRCPDGCAVMYINLDNWIPEEFPVAEVKRMAPILLLQALRDPMTQVNGFKVIIDAKSNPLRHCSFQNIYLMYHGSQYCLPGKFHSYHLVNQSATSRFCIALMKPFFSEELKNKIHIHSSPEELLDFFPSYMIPTRYGGKLGDYDLTPWLRKAMKPEVLSNLLGRTRIS